MNAQGTMLKVNYDEIRYSAFKSAHIVHFKAYLSLKIELDFNHNDFGCEGHDVKSWRRRDEISKT
jgi:hypothetical protein